MDQRKKFYMFAKDAPDQDVMQQAIFYLSDQSKTGEWGMMDRGDPRRDAPIPADGLWETFSEARQKVVGKIRTPGEIMLTPEEVTLLLLPRDGGARIPYTRDEFHTLLALRKIAQQGRTPITARDVALLCSFAQPSHIRWLFAHRFPGLRMDGIVYDLLELTENRNPDPEQMKQIREILK